MEFPAVLTPDELLTSVAEIVARLQERKSAEKIAQLLITATDVLMLLVLLNSNVEIAVVCYSHPFEMTLIALSRLHNAQMHCGR